jgi:hypothetical protein
MTETKPTIEKASHEIKRLLIKARTKTYDANFPKSKERLIIFRINQALTQVGDST